MKVILVVGMFLSFTGQVTAAPQITEREKMAVGLCTTASKNQSKNVDRAKFIDECVKEQMAPTKKAVSPSAASDMSRSSATGACMLFIKKRLHDPDSAEFGHSSEAQVSINGNHALVIREVRAKNTYGAKRLSDFVCLIEKSGESLTPYFVGEKSQFTAEARALAKKWKLLQ